MHKSLRAMDVKQTLSNLAQMRTNRFIAEIKRQLDTSPQRRGSMVTSTCRVDTMCRRARAIKWAQEKLRPKYPQLAERVTAGQVMDGAGINTMIDNMAWILDHMPEDEDERAWITDVLDYMFAPLERAPGGQQGGDYGNRIGNEIMIGAKDLA